MTPTDLINAIHTMQLQPPDNTWYMDTGSTAHLTNDSGMLSNIYFLSKPRYILVGNDNNIPIQGHSSSILSSVNCSYFLNNVYHVPNIIKKFNIR